MSESTETAYFRGEGGIVIDLTLPLSEVMQDKVTRGQLVRVNADGSTFDGSAPTEADEPRRPAVNAPKNEWVGYAVSRGMSVDDADAATKADLIERFGQK